MILDGKIHGEMNAAKARKVIQTLGKKENGDRAYCTTSLCIVSRKKDMLIHQHWEHSLDTEWPRQYSHPTKMSPY